METIKPIKVLYIEDARESFEAIRVLLKLIPKKYELLPMITSLSVANDEIKRSKPDVLLVDLKLPIEGDDMAKVAKFITQIRHDNPKLTVLVHSAESNIRLDVVRAIVAAGVSYLIKEAIEMPEHLDRCIQHALTGGVVLDRHIVSYLDRIALSKAPSLFTPRENDVIELVARHMTNREIATELVIATSRVSEVVSDILDKLGVNRRSEIIEWYKEQKHLNKSP
jgi:two-component system nitrate/nitrite response regulator NarP